MRIGFIGLGSMGEPMARNLLRAGHELVVYNRTRNRADALVKEGARFADDPSAAAAGAEVVITMLADDHAVESVVFEEKGLLTSLPKGSVHVATSTITPDLSQRMAEAHKSRGQEFVAAPVFGRPEAAAAAKLFIVAAGAQSAIAKAKPVLDILGQRTFEIGDAPQQANLVKLIGNFLITCVIESLGESFALARKAGIDPSRVLEVLTATLFGAPVYNTYGAKILSESFSPAGFKLPLGLKDNRLVLQSAEKLAVPLPFANIVRDRFLAALANGHGELDWSAIALVISESAGLKPSS